MGVKIDVLAGTFINNCVTGVIKYMAVAPKMLLKHLANTAVIKYNIIFI